MDNIFSIAFNELIAENYSICETVYYAIFNNQFVDEKTKHMAQVNYWISKIENSGLESVKKDILRFDTSALDKVFLLAKQILLEEYDQATINVEELYSKGDLPLYAIEEWPLFKKYRKTAKYNEFKSSHPELFGIFAVEPKSGDLTDDCATKTVKEELKDAK